MGLGKKRSAKRGATKTVVRSPKRKAVAVTRTKAGKGSPKVNSRRK